MRFAIFSTAALLCISTPATDAADVPTAAELTSKPTFRQAYKKMLTFPAWVQTGQGTSSPVSSITIAGKPYTVGHICKPHDCGNHQMDVIFTARGTQSWALLSDRDQDNRPYRQTFLGTPDDTIANALKQSFKTNNPE